MKKRDTLFRSAKLNQFLIGVGGQPKARQTFFRTFTGRNRPKLYLATSQMASFLSDGEKLEARMPVQLCC